MEGFPAGFVYAAEGGFDIIEHESFRDVAFGRPRTEHGVYPGGVFDEQAEARFAAALRIFQKHFESVAVIDIRLGGEIGVGDFAAGFLIVDFCGLEGEPAEEVFVAAAVAELPEFCVVLFGGI